MFKPRIGILGVVFAGEVEAVGSQVTRFQVGQRIFGHTGVKILGGHAAYVCLPAEQAAVALIPDNVSFEEAASVPFGASTAVHFLRQAKIQKGQKILIYGASGAVGTAAVQLAKYFGAEVTGVCSTGNLELVRSLGADQVIDYTREDLSQLGQNYDIVFETVGKLPYADCLRLLRPKGTLILGSGMLTEMMRAGLTTLSTGYKVLVGTGSEKSEELRFFADLLETGLYKPVIDRIYPLDQIAEAHAYAEKGHKKGNVVINLR